MEDRIDCEWEQCQRDLSREQPDQGDHCLQSELLAEIGAVTELTQVLDVLIGQKRQCCLLSIAAGPKASLVCLVDDNTVCGNCREEGKTVGSLRPAGVVVEGHVGKTISRDR